MEPMKPMKTHGADEAHGTHEAMDGGKPWWPEDLGSPATSGAQNGTRYAFFPDKQRLLVEQDARCRPTTAATPDRRRGAGAGGGSSLTFTSQNGTVDLGSLKKLD